MRLVVSNLVEFLTEVNTVAKTQEAYKVSRSYHRVKKLAGLQNDPWQAFQILLEETDAGRAYRLVNSGLSDAAAIVMRESYKVSADAIRLANLNPADPLYLSKLQTALEKVPTVTEVNQLMGGRRAASHIHTHHTATKLWAGRLDIPAGDFDSMPALLLDEVLHTDPEDLLKGTKWTAFHDILDQNMAGVGTDPQAILIGLRETYRDFANVTESAPHPDVWIVTRAWLTTKGIP